MNAAAIIAAIEGVISTVVELAPTAVKLEQVIVPATQALWDHIVNKKVVEQSDLDALSSKIAALSASIQAPIPPEQADDV